ncbi:glycosyltransferase family 2 protein [Lacticaseibacillus paracasei]|uniref:glycosyltransferase family 2 protein n=1 Tax=Lacticaseibacillus paracasei TaxID=1597 RepID=UPI00404668E5
MLLTIVIPVYNVELYLHEFENSLIRISSDKIKLLFINDGSTDCSLEILREFQSSNPEKNIEILNLKNGGLSRARNIGIRKAQGNYIWFVDSDDILDLRYIDDLLSYLEVEAPDLLEIGVGQFNDGVQHAPQSSPLEIQKVSAGDLFHDLAFSQIENYAVGHIAKASIYQDDDHFFPVGRAFEDVATKYRVLMASKKCARTDYILYWYRQRVNSIVHSATLRSVKDILVTVDEIIETALPFEVTDKTELVLRILRLAYARLYEISDWNDETKLVEQSCRQKYIKVAQMYEVQLSLKSSFTFVLMKAHCYHMFFRVRKLAGSIKQLKGKKHESH